MYIGTFAQGNAPMAASAMLTAGLRCAPLMLLTLYTAMVTPNAQPATMTIQPEALPLVRCSTTFAGDASGYCWAAVARAAARTGPATTMPGSSHPRARMRKAVGQQITRSDGASAFPTISSPSWRRPYCDAETIRDSWNGLLLV